MSGKVGFPFEVGDIKALLFLIGVIQSIGYPYKSFTNIMYSMAFSKKLMKGQ